MDESTRRRRNGRPPLADNDPSVAVSVRLPGSRYDELFAKARRDRVSVPEYVRRALGINCRRVGSEEE